MEETVSTDLPPGVTAINVGNEAAGARGELESFARDFAAAVDGQVKDPKEKSKVNQALAQVNRELNDLGVNTKPRDASVVHADHAKQNQLTAKDAVGMAAGVIGTVTGNQTAQMISQILSSEEPKNGLGQLARIARAAGIKTVGKVSLDQAVSGAQANVGMLNAVKTLRDNGFGGDTIYASEQQMAQGGNDKKNFIRDTALKLKDNVKNGADHDLSQVLQKPVAKSEAQKRVEAGAGQNTGNSASQKTARDFSAATASAKRNGTAQVVQAAQNSGGMVPRHSEFKTTTDLLQLLGYAPAPNIVAAIDEIGNRHEEAMKEQDRLRKEAEEFKKQEEERLAAEQANVPVPRRAAGAQLLEQLKAAGVPVVSMELTPRMPEPIG